MLIGELSERTGVSHRMLRYYEAQGLLRAERTANGYRRYDTDAVRTVGHIRALLAAGLSTEVIRVVLPCVGATAPAALDLCPELVRTLREQLAAMDARIDGLQASRGALASYLPA